MLAQHHPIRVRVVEVAGSNPVTPTSEGIEASGVTLLKPFVLLGQEWWCLTGRFIVHGQCERLVIRKGAPESHIGSIPVHDVLLLAFD